MPQPYSVIRRNLVSDGDWQRRHFPLRRSYARV